MKFKYYLNNTVILLILILALALFMLGSLVSASPGIIKQGDAYTIGSSVKIRTMWDGVNAYWYVNDSTGKTVSYWTFPQVQSYRTTGGGSWQNEVPFSLDSSTINGNIMIQNFTLASGSKLSVQFEELLDGDIKMTWGIWGAYNRNYRIDFTSNSVLSNKGNLDTVKKIFAFNDGIQYRYDDIPASYAVTNSVDANKNFHQYIEVGNAYQVWKWIDPVIESGVTGTTSQTCTGLVNGSWCNFTSQINSPVSGNTSFTVSFASPALNWYNTSQPYRTTISGLVNTTSQSQYVFVNITNAAGTNNNTHVFLNGYGYNNFSNLEIVGDNGTKLNFSMDWNNTLGTNQTVPLTINRTNNVTSVNIYYGNQTNLNLSNYSKTYDVYGNDFRDNTCGIWSGGDCSNGYLAVSASINMATNQYKNTANTVWEWSMQGITGVEMQSRFWRADTGVTANGMSVYSSAGDMDLTNDATTIINTATPSYQARWMRFKVVNNSGTWSMYLNDVLQGTVLSGVDDVPNYWVFQVVGSTFNIDSVKIYTNNKIEGIWGAQESYTAGISNVNVYVIPQNHPISESKTSSTSPIVVNLTFTGVTPAQNFQVFGNWSGTVDVTISIIQSENATATSEIAVNGYYYLNSTYSPNNTVTNVLLTFPITNTTFINSVAKGTISVISNDTNVTTYAYNTTHITVNSSYIVGGSNNTYNFTIGYNYAPVVTFSNQTFTDNPMPIVFTATDNESNSLNYSIILNGNQTYGAGSPLNVRALAIGVYNVTLWVNETGTPTTAQNVSQTAYITKNAGTPVLISPANGSTQTASIVPLSVSLAWSNEGTSYNVVVASDSGFVNIVLNSEPTVNYSSVSIFNTGGYWWRVRTLNGTTYGNWSLNGNFTVNQSALGIGDGTEGIQGIVYVTSPAGNQLLSGANVYIWNNTWSGNTLSGANGYYLFSGLTTGIYNVRSTKEGYEDSLTEIVNTTSGTWVTRNILMKPATSTYIPLDHYVKFIVMSGFFQKYANVDASVYKGMDTVAYTTGTTGTDGSVTFKLTKTQRYRITFVNTSHSINKAITIFPVETTVYVIVDTTVSKWFSGTGATNIAENINVTVTTQTINTTAAFINVSYVDSRAQTSNLRFYFNQSNVSNPLNQTNLNITSSGTSNNINISYIVYGYGGQSYIVTVRATHTTYGDIVRSYGVGFGAVYADIDPDYLTWFAVAVIIFLAAFFGATTHAAGAIVVTLVGWVFYAFGWLGGLSMNIAGALVLATVIAIIANFNERARQEDFT